MTENPGPLPQIPERRYESPPVVEALCELYFTASQWDPTLQGLFYERVREEYPQKSQLDQVGIELRVAPGQAATRSISGEPRMRYTKQDSSRMLQVGRDLLVVNQLTPYSHYEEWREVVHNNLTLYRELAGPKGIAALGLRYINRITIPGDSVKMEEFFRVYAEIPEELGGAHGMFQLQVTIRPPCPGHQLMLTGRLKSSLSPVCSPCYLLGHEYHSTEAIPQ
jgi:uncharacterized protein (TIGR04255 family)